ncbi:hypothetical protein UlMin_024523 [Ulmus minor]
MACRYEVEVKLSSARDLKNVNWRNGLLRPYAVVWVDPNNKSSSRVDEDGDTNPTWDQTLIIPLLEPINDDTTLHVDIVHAGSEPDTKKLIGSGRLRLREVGDEVGYGERASRNLKLKRPSGRPHGKVDVKVSIRQPYYRASDSYAAPYGVPPPASRDYPAPPAYGNYSAPSQPRDPYYAAPPAGYPTSGGYNAPAYGAPSFGQVGQPSAPAEQKKKSKFGGMGMGAGLAMGAVAGVLGGLAIKEGVDYAEDKREAAREEEEYYVDEDDY